MSFKLILGDITEVDTYAIVNSLGPDGSIYGRLCKAILNKSEDFEMRTIISSIDNGKPGDTYITGAGKLPCKKVIHVITPFKRNDHDNSMLQKCYDNVINLAIEKGYKSIGLPLIGTVASGYSDSESYNALLAACRKIDELEEKEEKEIIELVAVSYLKKERIYDEVMDDIQNKLSPEIVRNSLRNPNLRKENKEAEKEIYKRYIFDIYSCCKLFSEVRFENTIEFDIQRYGSMMDPTHDYNFLVYLLQEKGLTEKEALSPWCDSEHRKQLRKNKDLKTKDMFQLAVIAGLTTTEFLEWLVACGKSLSPLSRIDRAIIKLIREKDLDDYIYPEVCKYFENNIGIKLTFNDLLPEEKKIDEAWKPMWKIEEELKNKQ